MNSYDKNFNSEISRILSDLYNNPHANKNVGIRRKQVKEDKKYIDYLVNNGFVKIIGTPNLSGKCMLQLESEGVLVIEKYNGWHNYKKEVIDKKQQTEKAKKLAIRYWWIPIAISALGLIVSIIALALSL